MRSSAVTYLSQGSRWLEEGGEEGEKQEGNGFQFS